jgi:very-short-patch-repair endonuclease
MPRRSQSQIEAWAKPVAEAARHSMTTEQAILWERIKDWGFEAEYDAIATTKNGGQYPYRFDMFHEAAQLAIEVDGSSHRKRKGRDRRRDTRFAVEGIVTLRFPNKRILKDLEAVLAEIAQAIEAGG